MATTPNAQLTKLALGIASVAALAGITGRLSGGSVQAEPNAPIARGVALPADQNYQQQVAPTLPNWAQEPTPVEAQPEPQPQYEGRERHDDDDDGEQWEDEDEEHGGSSFRFFAPRTTGTTGSQPGQTRAPQSERRTRTGHS
jgi:hypothetical protein